MGVCHDDYDLDEEEDDDDDYDHGKEEVGDDDYDHDEDGDDVYDHNEVGDDDYDHDEEEDDDSSPADNSASTLKLAVHQELSLSDGLFLIYLHPNILVVHHDKYKCTIYGKQ